MQKGEPRSTFTAAIGAIVFLALGSSCTQDPAPPLPENSHELGATVQAIEGPPTLTLTGIVATEFPAPVPVSLPWAPVIEVVDEGFQAQVGDTLIRLDTQTLEAWHRSGTYYLDQALSDAQNSQEGLDDKIIQVREKAQGHRDDIRKLEGRLKDLRREREQEALIARGDLNRAQTKLRRAERRASALQALYEQNAASSEEVKKAQAALDGAKDAVINAQAELELIEQGSTASSQQLALYAIEQHRLALVDGPGGPQARISALEQRKIRNKKNEGRRIKHLRRRTDRDLRALANAEITATTTGAILHRGQLSAGGRLPQGAPLFTVNGAALAIHIKIPEHIRDLVQTSDGENPAGSVVVRLGMRETPYTAQLKAIGGRSELGPDGKRFFRGTVVLDHKNPPIKDGQRVDLDLTLNAAVVGTLPGWLDSRERDPVLLREDGSTATVPAVRHEGRYLVLDSQVLGQRFRAQTNAAPAQSHMIGRIAAAKTKGIRTPSTNGRHQSLEMESFVPDGTNVYKGQEIGRVVSSRGYGADEDPIEKALESIDRAKADRILDEEEAENAVVMAAQEVAIARIGVLEARLNSLLTRFSSLEDPIRLAKTGLRDQSRQVQEAEIALGLAEMDHRDGTISRNALQDIRIQHQRALADLKKSEVDVANNILGRDWQAVWSADTKVITAGETLAAKRQAQRAKSIEASGKILSARNREQRRIERARNRITQERALTLLAPDDGIIYHHDNVGRLSVGQQVFGEEVFNLVIPGDWEITVEVGERAASRLKPGETVPVTLPALGNIRMETVIKSISPLHRISTEDRKRLEEGTATAYGEKVVEVTLGFSSDDPRITPGSLCHILLETDP